MTHLHLDEAQDIADAEYVAIQDVSEHRWYTRQLVVFERDGALFGFYYMEPASELQEDQDRFETDPVRVFPVSGREVTTTVYEVTEDGQ